MYHPGTLVAERYKIVRLLGEGGMGAVYEAEHVLLGRRMALKSLHPEIARHQDIVTRFQREGRAAAAVGHPNIAQVTDYGTHEGVAFLVMELLKGSDLAEKMASATPTKVTDACWLAAEVLSALSAAHAAGIVHRDLKPENIFLVEEAGRTKVRLLDFGVSKLQLPPDGQGRKITNGAAIGTPGYMAPEQWMGLADLDHRADLYAVGVILYEMLCGSLPFDGATRGDLYNSVVLGDDAPEAAAKNPEVPAELSAAIRKALSRDRNARFQTAAEFCDALRPFGAADVEIDRSAPGSRVPSSLSEHPPEVATPLTRAKARDARATNTSLQIPVKPSGVWYIIGGAALVVLLVVAATQFFGAGSRPAVTPARATVASPAQSPPVEASAPEVVPAAPAPVSALPTARVAPAPHPVARVVPVRRERPRGVGGIDIAREF